MLISKESIFLNENLTSQEEVFRFISQKAVTLGVSADENAVYNGLVEREQQGTTGMMDGFAIPHAKSSAIMTPKIVIVRLNDGIDWNSMDGKPTSFIFSLLIPDGEAGTTHLKLLATVARMLMKADVKESLLGATTAEQLEEVLNSHLAG